MSIYKTRIEEFLALAGNYPVFDVRSPGEYAHAHIPGACNLPLFSDEERKIVGTAYKQQSREAAIKAGLDFFGTKMRKMVEEAEGLVEKHKTNIPNPLFLRLHPRGTIPNTRQNTVLVHCWRGGMRSAGVAWLLGLYGFDVYTLAGGYKAFRNWAMKQFERPYQFSVIGGYTGSGKTLVLKELENTGHATVDLEGIAHHKGSAFGDLGEPEQPTQEMFENKLALALASLPESEAAWIEDESQRIGSVNIPAALWASMRQCPVFFLEVPFGERLKYITEEYGQFDKGKLVSAVTRIQKRLGGLNTKNVVSHLLGDNFTEAFRILLSYYDKYYAKGLHSRQNLADLLTVVPCPGTDPLSNCVSLLSAWSDKKEYLIQ